MQHLYTQSEYSKSSGNFLSQERAHAIMSTADGSFNSRVTGVRVVKAQPIHIARLILSTFSSQRLNFFYEATMIRFLQKKLVWRGFSKKTSFERNFSNLSYISFLGVNFENLTVKFHVPYVLNMHIKFHSNRILFTI